MKYEWNGSSVSEWVVNVMNLQRMEFTYSLLMLNKSTHFIAFGQANDCHCVCVWCTALNFLDELNEWETYRNRERKRERWHFVVHIWHTSKLYGTFISVVEPDDDVKKTERDRTPNTRTDTSEKEKHHVCGTMCDMGCCCFCFCFSICISVYFYSSIFIFVFVFFCLHFVCANAQYLLISLCTQMHTHTHKNTPIWACDGGGYIKSNIFKLEYQKKKGKLSCSCLA